jgi:sporulation protein YlmC with PRC-barrel domain
MHMIRDLLDKQVKDRNGRKLGKVDGIVLEVREGEPPRLAAITLGAVVLAGRLGPRLARWTRAFEIAAGIGDGEPLRIPVTRIEDRDIEVVADVAAGETSAWAWERWLRGHVVGRIPGGKAAR